MNYFGVTLEGNIVFLGTFATVEEAENAAAEYGKDEACDACGHASDDTVYFGTREHFNAMFRRLEQEVGIMDPLPNTFAYDRGAQDCRLGYGRETNPYKIGWSSRRAWQRGWDSEASK